MKRHVLLLVLAATAGLGMMPAQQSAPVLLNPVKKILRDGGIVIGGTIQSSNPDTAAIMANAGFDFLWIEGEHSPLTLESTRNIVLLTQGRKAVPFTRVPVNELWTAKRLLDIGSLGVIFPFTDSVELARQAVAACKYPPVGRRGVGPGMASMRWPAAGGYPKWADDNVMVIVIVERPVAIEHIEEIAAVPGIDVLFMGLNDLSYNYGVPGQLRAPVMKAAIERVMSAAKKNNLAVGGPGGASEIKGMIEEGFRFIQGPSDLSLLQTAARGFFEGIRAGGVAHKDPVPIY
ncbi:MAG: aldolase [Acidobacteria bacterium]|nr:aldolase [Acidobacteriota bacterium]